MSVDSLRNPDVSFLLKKLDNHIQRYLYSLYKRKEVDECSLMNMWVSDFLYDNRDKDIYQKDIEAEFFISRATASKMLALMETKQLIERTVSEQDLRSKRVVLLPKGIELHELCVKTQKEIEEKLTQNMSSEDIALFVSLCKRLILNMED